MDLAIPFWFWEGRFHINPVISQSFGSQMTSQALFVPVRLTEEDTSCLDSRKTSYEERDVWKVLCWVFAILYALLEVNLAIIHTKP